MNSATEMAEICLKEMVNNLDEMSEEFESYSLLGKAIKSLETETRSDLELEGLRAMVDDLVERIASLRDEVESAKTHISVRFGR